jgi:hypothetical protein
VLFVIDVIEMRFDIGAFPFYLLPFHANGRPFLVVNKANGKVYFIIPPFDLNLRKERISGFYVSYLGFNAVSPVTFNILNVSIQCLTIFLIDLRITSQHIPAVLFNGFFFY